MSTDRSDGELLRSAVQDPSALEELYARYVGRVTAYAVRRCDQPADVADLVAATFLAVMESSTGYDESRGPVFPWIIGIASRIHANRVRRRYRERRALDRSIRIELSPDDISVLEERIDAARQAPEVKRALDLLKPQHREALRLIAHDGLTTEEAAHAVGVSVSTLRKRVSRARAALRRQLGDDRSQFLIGQPNEEVTG